MKSPRRRTASFDVGGRYVFIVQQRTGWESLRFASRQKARRSALQRFEHFLRVAIRLHAVPRFLDLPALVDQERGSDHALTTARPLAHAPYASCALRSGSLRSGNFSLNFSWNARCDAASSRETPRTGMPSDWKAVRLSLNWQASTVQPGVSSFG